MTLLTLVTGTISAVCHSLTASLLTLLGVGVVLMMKRLEGKFVFEDYVHGKNNH